MDTSGSNAPPGKHQWFFSQRYFKCGELFEKADTGRKENPTFPIHPCNGNPGYLRSVYMPLAIKSLLCCWLYTTWHNKLTNSQHYIDYTEEEMKPRKVQNMALGHPARCWWERPGSIFCCLWIAGCKGQRYDLGNVLSKDLCVECLFPSLWYFCPAVDP